MDRLTLWEVFIFSVPEALVIISIALGLAGVKFDTVKGTAMSLSLGLILYFIRPLVTSYIVNVIIYVILLVTLFLLFKMMDLFRSIMSVTLAVSIYLIIEYLNVNAMQFLFDLDPTVLLQNYALRFACFLPQLAVAILFSILIRKYRLFLFVE
ncbi:hypothetical protein M2349_001805 [Caldanaerobacter subterraneus subsp. tengcongensis MB4]|uniref:Uncharacterized protein n=1 Tax=Caldanaerobacter subterraneus subsp. tengcongensis (strain DSM 15242 / JCM 11007 / NBRC 100824 / MB4) TaxID=273068 RepID=Q8RC78_CALS4|nr:hypothetical protein [Caldanaerobacter subterraneus]AAM23836.1 hypothetical protein TTE0560 [Caldanaerobacter subterraneus subsp. tengcongensis MB4]MCS3916664.1 hypothetical protein [Caldanaerobacter subterraneus subsp. tengcongensis MB4]